MTFILKIDYFQKQEDLSGNQGEFSENRKTASKTGSYHAKKRELTSLVCKYTTCVPGYTTASVNI